MRAFLALALLGLSACGSSGDGSGSATPKEAQAKKVADALEQACAASTTYDHLKRLVFDEARRVRKAGSAELDTLRANAVVRMEEPVVASKDDPLTIVSCTGRFIVELPPGYSDVFDGDQRLSAEIGYTVQKAADGSGLVYAISKAEPIVYRLAAFDIAKRAVEPGEAEADGNAIAPVEPPPPPVAAPAPAVVPPLQEASRPSFDCRYARSRVERMICADGRLASLDRLIARLYFDAIETVDRRTARMIRQSREPFLEYRDECEDAACVAEAYQDRIAELRDYLAQ